MTDQVFVARERELNQLNIFLDQALAGQGQICFVTGEAGAGKTALVTEFGRRAQAQHDDLLVAIGDCNAQTGIGDPYLPFREILAQLTGDVDATTLSADNANRLQSFLGVSGKALVELGPDLIDVFVPGAGVATRAATMVAGKFGWTDQLQASKERQMTEDSGLEQRHLFEQYTNVLQALAAQESLILVIDDLQWADADSISLLFHLGRRIENSPILIVGTYRPDEVALGRRGERHPLEKVLAELKRYYGDVWVDLDRTQQAEGREFVDAFLATEPNRLGVEFRDALFRRTKGHPLFTRELLRAMQERGDLVQDAEGHWIEGPALDWEVLPARVEGVIEERIGRLEAELRETLTVASVEGEDFTAEVVAKVRAVEERDLVRRLSGELDKQHRLVRAEGRQRVGRQRLSLYRFQHNSFQMYLYNHLDEVERGFLHEDVGYVLEELYGDQAEEVASQLAYHFVEADVPEKARHYLRVAGKRAAAGAAYTEAAKYFTEALALTEEDKVAERYTLLLAREAVYHMLGNRTAQADDLDELETLAQVSLGAASQAEVALRQARAGEVIGEYDIAMTAGQAALELAQTAERSDLRASGLYHLGRVAFRQGDFAVGRGYFEQALVIAREIDDRRREGVILRWLGNAANAKGNFAAAEGYHRQALAIAREIGDRPAEIAALHMLGVTANDQGGYATARGYHEQVVAIARQIGHRDLEGSSLHHLAYVATEEGDYVTAWRHAKRALPIAQEMGSRLGEVWTLNDLGRVAAEQGDFAAGRGYLEQALTMVREIGGRRVESWTLNYLGRVAVEQGDHAKARGYYEQTLAIAREIGDRQFEGLALVGLGYALTGLEQFEEAAAVLQAAIPLWRELGHPARLVESQATLAGVHLAQGADTRALSIVEEVVAYLDDGGTLDGALRRLCVPLTCYRVLAANDDPRADGMLRLAHAQLQTLAARVDDNLRRSFLGNVPCHREILSEWEKVQDD